MEILYVVIGILVLVFVIIYNNLVKLNIRCNNAWASIDNQLKRRADLIPNLVEITKGYAKYESETLLKIVAERNKATIGEIANNSEKVSNNLKNLFALTEAYPELKANELFKNLQIELVGTEDKIAFARQFYNDCVQRFNTAIMVFPNNLLASMFNYHEKEYFKVSDSEREVVKVDVSK